jgi:hypothetical protein
MAFEPDNDDVYTEARALAATMSGREIVEVAVKVCLRALRRHTAAQGRDDALDAAVGSAEDAASLYGSIKLLVCSGLITDYFTPDAIELLDRLHEGTVLCMAQFVHKETNKKSLAGRASAKKRANAERNTEFMRLYRLQDPHAPKQTKIDRAIKQMNQPEHRAQLNALGRSRLYALAKSAEGLD